jgi:predicted AAA+ superfamily ATPase
VLQVSGQIILLEPYYKNLGKRLVKSPKLYMMDTGLAAFLMGFQNWQAVTRHPVMGALWETYVITQVVKHYHSRGKIVPLWFWRTIQGAEVDLLIEQGGQFIAIETKYSENPDKSCLKGINALKKFYGDENIISGYIASRTARQYTISGNIQAIPATAIDQNISGE